MRPELEQIQKIELYLNNKLSPKDKQAFEQNMATDDDLKSKVDFQRQFVKRLKRSALLVALENEHLNWAAGGQAAAGVKTTGSGIKLYILNNLNSIIIATLGIIGLSTTIHLLTQVDDNEVVIHENKEHIDSEVTGKSKSSKTQLTSNDYWQYENYVAKTIDDYSSKKEVEKEEHLILKDSISSKNNDIAEAEIAMPINPENLDFKTPPGYTIDPSKENTIIDTIANTKITIPPFAFRYRYRTRALVSTEVKIIYKEYRTKGDMVMSNIPMHWYGRDSIPFKFHSEGMFSILATSDSGSVELVKPIKVEFKPINLTDSLNFFYLADTNSRWQFVQEVPLPRRPIDTSQLKAYQNFKNAANNTGFGKEFGKGELRKPNWAEPKFSDDGNAYRYGFWGRLIEYFTKGTVYGVDSASFKRVFTERKIVERKDFMKDSESIAELGAIEIIDPEPQSITLQKLGYYNYDKLLKNPETIRPIIQPLDTKGEYIKRIYKIVAVEKDLNAAYHFYEPKLCLHSKKLYDFFAFTFDGRILYASRNRYSKAKSSSNLVLNFVDVTSLITKPDDVDELLANPNIMTSNSAL
jgi:hypothetical protein